MSKILIKGGRLITMESRYEAGARGDLLVVDDKIAAIGPSVDGGDAAVIDAADFIVMPGLIDSHVHTWQTGLRGVAGDWTVAEYMRAMHRGLATYFRPEDIYIANLVGALSKLNAGITTLVDWCHNNPTPDHTDAAIDGLEESGARALFLHGSPKPNPKPGQKHFSEMPMPRAEVERLRKGRMASDTRLVTMGLAVLGPQYSVHDVCVEDFKLAREYGLIASAHTGGAPLMSPGTFEQLIALGLIDQRTNIVHANNFDDALIKALVGAGASFSVTADVELQMGFGNPITGKLRALGSALSIGSDVEPAVAGDMFSTMRVTMNVQRNLDNLAALARGEPLPATTTITCYEALEWATINGAKMMGKADQIGSLAPGKQADITLIRTTDLNLHPVHSPVSSVVLQASLANVDTVLVAGKFVKRDGAMLFPGLRAKQEKLLESGRRILMDIGLLKEAA
ncbi:amidohydrolase family protein [Rhodoligotrophos defluvii]|uniref:amidohydrolase family protein n=1 Tax=Rhodoligotrophos defluvii TaxID=2561934 RepID=UPI0010C9FDF8|nr:amidohydrolase family protein [Rhodoligotrophos defluvii]